MTKHKCIYCLEEKEDTEFNREHVVPRMMGTYDNGYVLSNHQVCQACNSYFSTNIENSIGLDSYEAFLRMQYSPKTMSDGRALGNKRIRFHGTEGIFKGLTFTVAADTSLGERFHMAIEPCVGIEQENGEYQYYPLEELPQISEEQREELRDQHKRIIQFGYEKETVEAALKEKGYIKDGSFTFSMGSIEQEYNEPDFTAGISFSVDSIIRRVCAKTVFNYLCYTTDSSYVLSPEFNAIRNYIRNGTWDENELWFRVSTGYVSAITPPNDTCHVVGYMLYVHDGKAELVGCLTWFGAITYIFHLADIKPQCSTANVIELPAVDTRMCIFDNQGRTVSEADPATYIYGGRPDER